MSVYNTKKMYVRLATDTGTSTAPTSWTVIEDSDFLQGMGSDLSGTINSQNSTSGKVYKSDAVIAETFSFNALNDDGSAQISVIKTLARAGGKVWVQRFETLTTADTVATDDVGEEFIGVISACTETYPNNDLVNHAVTIEIDNSRFGPRSVTIA